MSTVLIAGGTGLIGKRLSQLLTEQNYQVSILSRRKHTTSKYKYYQWNLEKDYIEAEAIQKADYIINLSGAGIVDKLWTKARKQLIIDSRVQSNNLLVDYCQKLKKQPKAFIAASAIGYYGSRGDEWLEEDAAPGSSGFLPYSCVEWEKSIDNIERTNIRTVKIRVGIVLSSQGGALAKILPSFKVGIGSYLGDGQQYYSWIHIDDLCNIFIKAIQDENLQGTYNAVAPNPVTNKTLTIGIKEALDSNALIVPVPKIVLRLTMGEMADMLLESSRVASNKIRQAGFNFMFPDLVPALKNILKQKV